MSERQRPTDAEIGELLAPLAKVIRDTLISTPVTLGHAGGIEDLTARLTLAVAKYNSRILPDTAVAFPASTPAATGPAEAPTGVDPEAAAQRRRVSAAADWIAAHFADRYAPWGYVLAKATVDAGYAVDDVEAARAALRLVYDSNRNLRVERGVCVACGGVTAYRESNHAGLSLCRGCVSPIRVWEWRSMAEPDAGRKRRVPELHTLSHRPGGWPANEPVPADDGTVLGHDRLKACGSTLTRAREKRPMCADPVVYRSQVTVGRRKASVQYWCDADLPDGLRPETTRAKQR